MFILFDSYKFVLLKNTKEGEACDTEAQGLLLCVNAGAQSSQCLRLGADSWSYFSERV